VLFIRLTYLLINCRVSIISTSDITAEGIHTGRLSYVAVSLPRNRKRIHWSWRNPS